MSGFKRGGTVRSRIIPKNFDDWRELLLTMLSLYVGFIYAFGPERLQQAGSLSYITEKFSAVGGMDFVGWISLGLAIVLIVNRFTGFRPWFNRVAHSIGAGIYFLYAAAVLATLFDGTAQSGAGWAFIFVASWLHFRSGAESPPLPGREHTVT